MTNEDKIFLSIYYYLCIYLNSAVILQSYFSLKASEGEVTVENYFKWLTWFVLSPWAMRKIKIVWQVYVEKS